MSVCVLIAPLTIPMACPQVGRCVGRGGEAIAPAVTCPETLGVGQGRFSGVSPARDFAGR